MTALYVAAACLVVAQVLGIYALVTKKADLMFSIVMIILVAGAIGIGVYGVYTDLL